MGPPNGLLACRTAFSPTRPTRLAQVGVGRNQRARPATRRRNLSRCCGRPLRGRWRAAEDDADGQPLVTAATPTPRAASVLRRPWSRGGPTSPPKPRQCSSTREGWVSASSWPLRAACSTGDGLCNEGTCCRDRSPRDLCRNTCAPCGTLGSYRHSTPAQRRPCCHRGPASPTHGPCAASRELSASRPQTRKSGRCRVDLGAACCFPLARAKRHRACNKPTSGSAAPEAARAAQR